MPISKLFPIPLLLLMLAFAPMVYADSGDFLIDGKYITDRNLNLVLSVLVSGDPGVIYDHLTYEGQLNSALEDLNVKLHAAYGIKGEIVSVLPAGMAEITFSGDTGILPSNIYGCVGPEGADVENERPRPHYVPDITSEYGRGLISRIMLEERKPNVRPDSRPSFIKRCWLSIFQALAKR